MKLRRIFAAIAACAVAATMAVSASAADGMTGTVGCEDLVLHGDDGKDYPVVTTGDSWTFDVKTLNSLGLAGDLDLTGIYGFSVTFKEFDLSENPNGGIIVNKQSGWDQKTWSNLTEDDKGTKYDFVLDSEKFTLTRLDDTPMFTAEDVDPAGTKWASLVVSSWWGPKPEITSFSILGKDGAVMKTFDADHKIEAPKEEPKEDPSSTATSSTTSSTASATDKNEPTGATAGLALAGLAIAGAAVVAAKKSK